MLAPSCHNFKSGPSSVQTEGLRPHSVKFQTPKKCISGSHALSGARRPGSATASSYSSSHAGKHEISTKNPRLQAPFRKASRFGCIDFRKSHDSGAKETREWHSEFRLAAPSRRGRPLFNLLVCFLVGSPKTQMFGEMRFRKWAGSPGNGIARCASLLAGPILEVALGVTRGADI